MIGRAVLFSALVLPLGAAADGVRDTPRALEVFAAVSGYSDISDGRYGTPAAPAPSELGVIMVSRMFRNVCLGIEAGASLETVLPAGFSIHSSAFWLMGDDTPRTGGPLVLSSTGDIAQDEDDGHPSIELRPDAGGMICRINWRMPEALGQAQQAAISDLIATWVPWEYALVAAARPEPAGDPSMSRLLEWDRPCGDRWCAMSALFSLGRGDISLSTTLDITDIEGDRP